MPERADLIDLAIEQLMAGMDNLEREQLLRDFLSDEWHSAPCEAQDRLIRDTGAHKLWEAGQEQD